MKEENGDQGVGATAFDYPNSQHPGYKNKIHYGPQNVPEPVNAQAKVTYSDSMMPAVLEGK